MGRDSRVARRYMLRYTEQYISHGTGAVGKPLMLRDEDDRRIERLKARLGAPSKVQVVRSALDLLEARADREERVARWKRIVPLIAESSAEVNREFRAGNRRRWARVDD